MTINNFLGRSARWGLQNLQVEVMQVEVIDKNPDDVVIWWGVNDFMGCAGTTFPDTNLPNPAEFNYLLNRHITALQGQIEILAGLGKPVYVLNEPRMNGGLLPWTHFAQDGSVVWELDHRCKFDWASDAIAQAQKQLVAEEAKKGLDVTLVDIWQLFMENQGVKGMYSLDIMHLGSVGREMTAELFLEVYHH